MEEGQWGPKQFDDMWWSVKDWARRFEGATLIHHSKHTLHQPTCPHLAINKGKPSTPDPSQIIVTHQSCFRQMLMIFNQISVKPYSHLLTKLLHLPLHAVLLSLQALGYR